MTYEESYMQCNNLKELLKEVKSDMAIAIMIGSKERIKSIKKNAEKVAKIKGW